MAVCSPSSEFQPLSPESSIPTSTSSEIEPPSPESSRGTNLLMSFLGILGAFAAASTNGQLVSSVHRNIALQIFFATTFVYFGVKIMHDLGIFTQNKSLLILGHIRFLSGTLSATILLIILTPYVGWAVFALWIIFLVKIAFCWDKPFYSFEMFRARDQTMTANETRNHNASTEVEDQNINGEEFITIEVQD